MNTRWCPFGRLRGLSASAIAAPLLFIALAAGAVEGSAPVHVLASEGAVREWLVLGPLPNPEPVNGQPGGDYRGAFFHDYLSALGGENKARLDLNSAVTFADESGAPQEARAQLVQAGPSGLTSLTRVFKTSHAAAYAFCYLESDRPRQFFGLFGSNDSARVWVNGVEVVTAYAPEGRACVPATDVFPFEAKAGLNAVLVKVEDAGGGAWEFIFEAVDPPALEARKAEQLRRQRLRTFQNMPLEPDGGYLIHPGPLPALKWKDTETVTGLFGGFPLETRWFFVRRSGAHPRFQEVTEARRPGFYVAHAQGRTGSGMAIRRMVSVYCAPKDWRPPLARLEKYVSALPIYEPKPVFGPNEPVSKTFWRERIAAMGKSGSTVFDNEWDAALVAAYDWTGKRSKLGFLDDPAALRNDALFAIRRHVEGAGSGARLQTPRRVKGQAAPVLRAGSAGQAGVAPDLAAKLDAHCTAWYEASQEPFSLLVARRGIIILHKAYGQPLDAATWNASITKCLTGLLFAQFVEQGLIGIDDPIGRYLPDFPVSGEKVITARHLFTHTTGLEGHLEMGNIYNPYLDNAIANGLERLTPGTLHQYNGMGYDLAGKLMEAVAGKPILRLLHENYLAPLGVQHTTYGDLGGISFSPVGDLARFGQLMLNGGRYGKVQFFSPATLERIKPEPLNRYFPDLNLEWGMGIVWMREPAAAGDPPGKKYTLSQNTFGHGAASASILRVDPDNELVIAQTRNQAGPQYAEFARELFRIIESGLPSK